VGLLHNLPTLIRLKVEVLLHDPPHKSHLIGLLKENFGKRHEEEARTFRSIVLGGTSFSEFSEELRPLIALCDRLASSAERRFIRASHLGNWPRGIYVDYSKLHNIFNPSRSRDVSVSSMSINNPNALLERVMRVGERINRVLRQVSRVADEVTVYNTLYALLEPAWYAEGLYPSLADTRVPSHTIFDHLYASATIANIVTRADTVKLKGYYVLVDYPGIQSFIGSGRKAGDFWAASWMLSNLMWRLGLNYARKYGFDVFVSPTARLNPYTIKTLKTIIADNASDAAREAEKILATALGLSETELGVISEQPLIPATLSLLFPPVDYSSPEEVAESFERAYREAWRSLVREAECGLSDSEDVSSRLTSYLLREICDIINEPPQGVRIYVVDVEKIHEKLISCLVEGVRDACEDLGLEISKSNYAEFTKMPLEVKREFTSILLWHLLVTEATRLAVGNGCVRHPVPRPFFVYSQSKLTPISERIVESSGNWIPCTLCGVEPVIIKATKKPEMPDEYSDEFKDYVAKILSVKREKITLRDWSELKKHFKPGEALGPYCLLKRAVYLFKYAERKISFVSTDDIALEGFSAIISALREKYRDLLSEMSEIIARKGLLPEPAILTDLLLSTREVGKPKDITLAAEVSKLTYESFVRRVEDALEEVCRELSRRGDYAASFISALKERVVGQLSSQITEAVLSRPNYLELLGIERACRAHRLKTSYAILRGDADNIGKIHTGKIDFILGENLLENYFSNLYKGVVESIELGSYTAEIKEQLKKTIQNSLDTLKHGLELLGFEKRLPITPAWSASLSLSLMVSAIMDFKVITRNHGMLVFSGGDDVLALMPPETAFKTAIEIRGVFRDSGFIDIDNSGLVVPALPTGRSVSLRYADIKDHMNWEYEKALELLEEKAKEAKWIKSEESSFKDTLVISDSRSNVVVLLPLNTDTRQLTIHALSLGFLTGIGALSTGIPEDFKNYVSNPEYIRRTGLQTLALYIFKRNIPLRGENSKPVINELTTKLRELLEKASEVTLEISGERANLLVQLVNVLRITRRHL
jgi:CRISPR-associated protein Cmr2